jgi:hypothetical protein
VLFFIGKKIGMGLAQKLRLWEPIYHSSDMIYHKWRRKLFTAVDFTDASQERSAIPRMIDQPVRGGARR